MSTSVQLSQTERYAVYEAAKVTNPTEEAFINALTALELRETEDDLVYLLHNLDVRKLAAIAPNYRTTYMIYYLKALNFIATVINKAKNEQQQQQSLLVSSSTLSSSSSSSTTSVSLTTTNSNLSSPISDIPTPLTTNTDDSYIVNFYELMIRYNILEINCCSYSWLFENINPPNVNSATPLRDYRDVHIHAKQYVKPMNYALNSADLGHIAFYFIRYFGNIMDAICMVTGKHLKAIVLETRRFILQGIRILFYDMVVKYNRIDNSRENWKLNSIVGQTVDYCLLHFQKLLNHNGPFTFDMVNTLIIKVCEENIQKFFNRLIGLSDNELRVLNYNTVLQMLGLEEAFRVLHGNCEVASKAVYKFRFYGAIRGLKAPMLDWRMQGARDLNSLAQDATRNETEKQYAGFWLYGEDFLELLHESKIMDEIVGERLHLEVMKALPLVFRIIVNNNQWTQALTTRLWLTAQNRHSAEQCAILNQLNTVIQTEAEVAADTFLDSDATKNITRLDTRFTDKPMFYAKFHHCYLPTFRQVCYLLEAAYLPITMRSNNNPYSNTEELLISKRQAWALAQYNNGVSINAIINAIGDNGSLLSFLQQNIPKTTTNSNKRDDEVIEPITEVLPYILDRHHISSDIYLQPQVIPFLGLESTLPKAIEDLLTAMRLSLCSEDSSDTHMFCLEKSTVELFVKLLSKLYRVAPCPIYSTWSIPDQPDEYRYPARPLPESGLHRSIDDMLSPCARTLLSLLFNFCKTIEQSLFATVQIRGKNSAEYSYPTASQFIANRSSFFLHYFPDPRVPDRKYPITSQLLSFYTEKNQHVQFHLYMPPVLYGSEIVYECIYDMCREEGIPLQDTKPTQSTLSSNISLSSSSSVSSSNTLSWKMDPSRLPRFAAFIAQMSSNLYYDWNSYDNDEFDPASCNPLKSFTRRREKFLVDGYTNAIIDFINNENIIHNFATGFDSLLQLAMNMSNNAQNTGITSTINNNSLQSYNLSDHVILLEATNPLVIHTLLAIIHILRTLLRYNLLDLENDGKVDVCSLFRSIVQRDLDYAQEGEVNSEGMEHSGIMNTTEDSYYVRYHKIPGLDIISDDIETSIDRNDENTGSSSIQASNTKHSLSWAVEKDPNWLVLPGVPDSNTHGSITINEIRYLLNISQYNEVARHAVLLFIADGLNWYGPADTNLYLQILQAPSNNKAIIPEMQQLDSGMLVPFSEAYVLSRRSEFIYDLWNLLIDYFICNGQNLANMDRYTLYTIRIALFVRNSNDDLWTQIYLDPFYVLKLFQAYLRDSNYSPADIQDIIADFHTRIVSDTGNETWEELGSMGRALFPFINEYPDFYQYIIEVGNTNPKDIENLFATRVGKRPIHQLRTLETKRPKTINEDTRGIQIMSFNNIIGLGTLLHRILLYTNAEGIWTSVAETLVGLALVCSPDLRAEHVNSLVNHIVSLLQRIDPSRSTNEDNKKSGSSNKRARSVNDEVINNFRSLNTNDNTDNVTSNINRLDSINIVDLLTDDDINQMSIAQRQECMRRLLFLLRRLIAELPERLIRNNLFAFYPSDIADAIRLCRSHYDDTTAEVTDMTVNVVVFDHAEMRKVHKQEYARIEALRATYGSNDNLPAEDMAYYLSKQQSNINNWVPSRKFTIKVNSNDTVEAVRHRIADLFHIDLNRNTVPLSPVSTKYTPVQSNAPVWVFPGDRNDLGNLYDVNHMTPSVILIDSAFGTELEGYINKVPIQITTISGSIFGKKSFIKEADGLRDPDNVKLSDAKLRDYINSIVLSRSIHAGPLMVPLADASDIYGSNSITGWKSMVALDASAIGSAKQSNTTAVDTLLDGRVSYNLAAMPPHSQNGISNTSVDFGNLFVAGGVVLDPVIMRILLNILSASTNIDTENTENTIGFEALRCEVWKIMNYSIPSSPLVLGLLGTHRIQWNNVFTCSPSLNSSTPPYSSGSGPIRNFNHHTTGYALPILDELQLSPTLFYGGTLASVYLLQCVISYLRPPLQPLVWMNPTEGPVRWARQFIDDGGLHVILSYLFQTSSTSLDSMDSDDINTNINIERISSIGLGSLIPKLLRTACLRILFCLLDMSPSYTLSSTTEYKEIIEKYQKVFKMIPNAGQNSTQLSTNIGNPHDNISIADLVYTGLTTQQKELLIRSLWSQIAGEESETSNFISNATSLVSESIDTAMDISPTASNPPLAPRIKRGRSLESPVASPDKTTSDEQDTIVSIPPDNRYLWSTNTKLLRNNTNQYVNTVSTNINDRALRDGIKMLQLLIDNENKNRSITNTITDSNTDEVSLFERCVGPRQIQAVLRTLLYDPAKVGEEGQKALFHCMAKVIKESPRLAQAIVHEAIVDLTKFVHLLDPENKAVEAIIPTSMIMELNSLGTNKSTNLTQYAHDICIGVANIDVQLPPINQFDLRGANIEEYMNLIKLAIDSMNKSKGSPSSNINKGSVSPSTSNSIDDQTDLLNILQLLMRVISACSLSLRPTIRTSALLSLEKMMLSSSNNSDTATSIVSGSNIGVSGSSSTSDPAVESIVYPFTAIPIDITLFLNSMVALASAAVNVAIPSIIDSVRLVNLLLYHGLYRTNLPLLGATGSSLDISTTSSSFSSTLTRKNAWDIIQALAMPSYGKIKENDSTSRLLRSRLVSETADFIRTILEEGNLPTRSFSSPWLRYASLPLYNTSSQYSYVALSSATGQSKSIVRSNSSGVYRTDSGNTMKALSMVLPESFPSIEDITGIAPSAGTTVVPLISTGNSSAVTTPSSFLRLPKDIPFYAGLFMRLWPRLELLASTNRWQQFALNASGELRQWCGIQEQLNELPHGFGKAIVDQLSLPFQRPNTLPLLLGGEMYESVSLVDFIHTSNFLSMASSNGVLHALEANSFMNRLTKRALVASMEVSSIDKVQNIETFNASLKALAENSVFFDTIVWHVSCYIFMILQTIATTIDPRFVSGVGITLSIPVIPPPPSTTSTSDKKDAATASTPEPSPSHTFTLDVLLAAAQFGLSMYFGHAEEYNMQLILSKPAFNVVDQAIIAIGNRSNPPVDFTNRDTVIKIYAGLVLLANQEGFTDLDAWIAHVRLFSKVDHASRELSLANLQSTTYIRSTHYEIDQYRSDAIHGCFIGLKNQGATCYMNSLLQQMFMNPTLRHAVLCSDTLDSHIIDKHKYASSLRKLRDEMQLLFSALCFSARTSYDPLSFVLACDNVPSGFFPLDSPVRSQNDANEFFSLLLDRLGNVFPYPSLRTKPTISTVEMQDTVTGETDTDMVNKTKETSTPPDIFTATIGGVVVNQMIGQGECKHTRERDEQYLYLSIDVDGHDTIEKSLKAFVQGELLAGDNAYMCETCNKKVDAVKRSCIATLPDSLIIHLKRFRLNLETFNKEKVNDYLHFGFNVDLYPYTAMGLSDAEGTLPKEGIPPHFITKEDCLYELRGVLVHSGHANSGHYYSFICPRDGDTLPGSGSGLRALAAQYRHRRDNLPAHVAQIFTAHANAGVDIDALFATIDSTISTDPKGSSPSTGTNTSGWLEFNDETIAPFETNSSNCESVWFGGTTSVIGADGKQKTRVRSTNAFMLFYDRVRPVVSVPVSSDLVQNKQEMAGTTLGSSSPTVAPQVSTDHPVPKIFARSNNNTSTNINVLAAQQTLRIPNLPTVVPTTAASAVQTDNNNYLRSVYITETPSVNYLCAAAEKLVVSYEVEANQIAMIYERAKEILQKRYTGKNSLYVPVTEKYLQLSSSLHHIVSHADSLQRLLFGALAKREEKPDSTEIVKRASRVLLSMAGSESQNKLVRTGGPNSQYTRDIYLNEVMNVLHITDQNDLSGEATRQSITLSLGQGGIGTSDEGTHDAYRLDVIESIIRGFVFPGVDIYWDTMGSTLHMTDTAAAIAAANSVTPPSSPKVKLKSTPNNKSSTSSSTTVPVTPTAPTIRDSRHLSGIFEVAFNQGKDGALTRQAIKVLLPVLSTMLATMAEPLGPYILGENVETEISVLGLPYPLLSTEYRQQRIAQRSKGTGKTTTTTSASSNVVDLTSDEITMDTEGLQTKQLVFQTSPLTTFQYNRAQRALRALDLLIRTFIPFIGVVISNPLSESYEVMIQILQDMVISHPIVAAIMVRNHLVEWILQIFYHAQSSVWTGVTTPPVNSSPFDYLIGRMQDLTQVSGTGNVNTSYSNFGYVDDADIATALAAINTSTPATEGRQQTSFSEVQMGPLYTLLSAVVRTMNIPDLSDNERDTLARPSYPKLKSIPTSTTTSLSSNNTVPTHNDSPFAVFKNTSIRSRFRTTAARDFLLNPEWLYRFIRNGAATPVLRKGFEPLIECLQHLSFGNPHISAMYLTVIADIVFKAGVNPIILEHAVCYTVDHLVTHPILNMDCYELVRLSSVLFTIDERVFTRPATIKMINPSQMHKPSWAEPESEYSSKPANEIKLHFQGPRTLPYGTIPYVSPIVVDTIKAQGLNPWLDYVFASSDKRDECSNFWNSVIEATTGESSSSSSSNISEEINTGILHRYGLASYILDLVTVFIYYFDWNEDLANPPSNGLETYDHTRFRINNDYFDHIAESSIVIHQILNKASPVVREAMMKLPTFIPFVPTVWDILAFAHDRMSHILARYGKSVNESWQGVFIRSVKILRDITGRTADIRHRYTVAPSVLPHQYLCGGADPAKSQIIFNPDNYSNINPISNDDNIDDHSNIQDIVHDELNDLRGPAPLVEENRPTKPSPLNINVIGRHGVAGAGTGGLGITLPGGGDNDPRKVTSLVPYGNNANNDMDDSNSVNVSAGADDDEDRAALLQSQNDEYDQEDVSPDWDTHAVNYHPQMQAAHTMQALGQAYDNPTDVDMDTEGTINRIHTMQRYIREPVEITQINATLIQANLPSDLRKALNVLADIVDRGWQKLPDTAEGLPRLVSDDSPIDNILRDPKLRKLWIVWSIVENATSLSSDELEPLDIETLCFSVMEKVNDATRMLNGQYRHIAENSERWPIYIASYGFVPLINTLLTKDFNEFKNAIAIFNKKQQNMKPQTMFEGGMPRLSTVQPPLPPNYGTTKATTLPSGIKRPNLTGPIQNVDLDDDDELQSQELRINCFSTLDTISRNMAVADEDSFANLLSDSEVFEEGYTTQIKHGITESEALQVLGKANTHGERNQILSWALFRNATKLVLNSPTAQGSKFQWNNAITTNEPGPPNSTAIKLHNGLHDAFRSMISRIQYVLENNPTFLGNVEPAIEEFTKVSNAYYQVTHQGNLTNLINRNKTINPPDIDDEEVLEEEMHQKLEEVALQFIAVCTVLFIIDKSLATVIIKLHHAVTTLVDRDASRTNFARIIKEIDDFITFNPPKLRQYIDSQDYDKLIDETYECICQLLSNHNSPRYNPDNTTNEDNTNIGAIFIADYYSWLVAFAKNISITNLNERKNTPLSRNPPVVSQSAQPPIPPKTNSPSQQMNPSAPSYQIIRNTINQLITSLVPYTDSIFDEENPNIRTTFDKVLKQLYTLYSQLYQNPKKAMFEIAKYKASIGLHLLGQNIGGIDDALSNDVDMHTADNEEEEEDDEDTTEESDTV